MTATNPLNRERLRERLVSLTRDLMLIPSHQNQPDQIRRALDSVCNHLEVLSDLEVREYVSDGHPSLVALPKGVSCPDVLLYGHIDVIEHDAPEAYRSRLEGDRIIGPGSGDMKGALAILIELMHEFHANGRRASLGLVVTSDEEVGGMHGMRYLFEEIGLRAGAVIIPDGGAPGEIIIEEKGILHLRLSCTGRAAHAARPWLGINPLSLLFERTVELQQWFASLHRPCEADAPEHWYSTCALTVVKTPNATINRVPEAAEAILDVRFIPPWSAEELLERVQEVLGPQIDTEAIIWANPSRLAPDPAFLAAMGRVLGRNPHLRREDGGSDGRFVAPFDIPVMITRPHVGNLHATDEWIDIDSMLTFYEICREYLLERESS